MPLLRDSGVSHKEPAIVKAAIVHQHKKSQRNKKTILVAEDERVLRELICEILKQNGYNVVAAINGKDALSLVEVTHGEIHALLTDLRMPEMGGVELAEELRRSRPSLPVIYTSGYSNGSIRRGPLLDYIEKPFQPEALINTLRSILDNSMVRGSGGSWA